MAIKGPKKNRLKLEYLLCYRATNIIILHEKTRPETRPCVAPRRPKSDTKTLHKGDIQTDARTDGHTLL